MDKNNLNEPIETAPDEAVKAPEAEVAPTPEERIAELEAQLQDVRLRAAAELANLNARAERERQSATRFAMQKFAIEMLSVKDYLEMALADKSGNFEALQMGVKMTLDALEKAFAAEHIEAIVPVAGTQPDPQCHEVLQQIEDAEQPSGSIVRVIQKGYRLHDRVIRAAKVCTAHTPTNQIEGAVS